MAVGVVQRVHLLFVGVRSVSSFLKEGEEEQQGLQQIEEHEKKRTLDGMESSIRFPGLDALPSVEPMPNLHVFTFSVIPSQLGRTDPFCVLQHDPTLILS